MPKTFSVSNSGDSDLIGPSYIEMAVDPLVLSSFAEERGIGAILTASSLSDELVELRSELIKELLRIIEVSLTAKQKQIIKLVFLDGKTQIEAAEAIGKNQSTIQKTLRGVEVVDINNKTNRKRYGGALKKLKRLCAHNDRIRDLMRQMGEQIAKDNKEAA